MKEFEKKIYSQNGEDGIIEHIFSKIGTTNKVAVEIGVSAFYSPGGMENTGTQNNTRLLADLGWTTYWYDSEKANNLPPNCKFEIQFLTKDNINPIFQNSGVPKEFDLLSIDVDGNDYHLREALSSYKPRVCIIEYNGFYNGSCEYIMPYNEEYRWRGEINFGASLKAYTTQGNRLGYDLVYCDSKGVNAFFIRQDVNVFTPKTSEEAFVKLFAVHREENLLDNRI